VAKIGATDLSHPPAEKPENVSDFHNTRWVGAGQQQKQSTHFVYDSIKDIFGLGRWCEREAAMQGVGGSGTATQQQRASLLKNVDENFKISINKFPLRKKIWYGWA